MAPAFVLEGDGDSLVHKRWIAEGCQKTECVCSSARRAMRRGASWCATADVAGWSRALTNLSGGGVRFAMRSLAMAVGFAFVVVRCLMWWSECCCVTASCEMAWGLSLARLRRAADSFGGRWPRIGALICCIAGWLSTAITAVVVAVLSHGEWTMDGLRKGATRS